MTIFGIHFSDLGLVVAGSTAWFGLCILLAVFLCRRAGPYDRPDYDKSHREADELWAQVFARSKR